MIRIQFLAPPEGGLQGFFLEGHAGYGEAGTDIVCAAVSSAVYLTVNKNNARAIRAYEKFGFLREGEECTAIGEGYYMDDYIYAIRLGNDEKN